ncbi:MAG: transcriptional repressor [Anaerolineae bacterium]|nr:transcriptional repressor [Anaerolineae bacterium]
MSESTETQIARALREAGYRLTKPRLAVAQVLAENVEGLTPEEIHQLAKVHYAPLGLVTVYRTLEILDELGVVRRVHSEERCQRYASAGPEKHYLVCQSCHRVLEFPCHGLANLIEGVRDATGYKITGHLLELRGICPECQRKDGL